MQRKREKKSEGAVLYLHKCLSKTKCNLESVFLFDAILASIFLSGFMNVQVRGKGMTIVSLVYQQPKYAIQCKISPTLKHPFGMWSPM
jgi:hypothetical protein